MVLQIKKISNVGSQHPIVARLTIGMHELLNFTGMEEEIKHQILDECFDIHRCLLLAEQEALPVIAEIKSVISDIEVNGIKKQGMTIHTPSVESLDRSRAFLKYTKQALQHTAKAIGLLFEENFNGPHFHKVLEASKRINGENHLLTKLLEEDQKWLKEIIDLRNEDEHPKSGKVFMKDFDIYENDQGGFTIDPPRFFNDAPILNRLEIFSHNSFTFAEEIIAHAIETKFPNEFRLFDINPEDRDPKMPKRYQVAFIKK